jgi:OHCU decarboxylase
VIPIDEFNALPPDAFAAALRPLFEAAEPLAARLHDCRPFRSYADLLDQAERIAFALPAADQRTVVNAHPRIGADPSTVSAASYREQGYAAEGDQDLSSVYAELTALNAEYERRFGFRFVVFVNRRSKAEILDVLRKRLSGEPEVERHAALRAMLDIARDRLRTSQAEPT